MGFLVETLRSSAGHLKAPLLARAAKAYISGPELSDALISCRSLSERGYATTVGLWNVRGEAPQRIADAQRLSIGVLGAQGLDTYCSIKVPALEYRRDLVEEIAARAREHGPTAIRRLHFDSHGPETQDQTLELAEQVAAQGGAVGVTLPGRWRRSLHDAEVAIERGHAVRVVKGQWPEVPGELDDPRDGFLKVIDRLAGRASSVAVATHDPVLAAEALSLLKQRGTSAELELLLGLPSRAVLRAADALGARVRVYVPYGYGWLPYSLGQAAERPSVAWWIVKDALLGGALGLPRRRAASTSL
ncbi:MAG: hypothetical protein U1E65_27005 [Myxococcota bacterium]